MSIFTAVVIFGGILWNQHLEEKDNLAQELAEVRSKVEAMESENRDLKKLLTKNSQKVEGVEKGQKEQLRKVEQLSNEVNKNQKLQF